MTKTLIGYLRGILVTAVCCLELGSPVRAEIGDVVLIELEISSPDGSWNSRLIINPESGKALTDSDTVMDFRFDESSDTLCGPLDPPEGICTTIIGLSLVDTSELREGVEYPAEFSIGGTGTVTIMRLISE